MTGPLQGYKVVELSGIGPGPLAAMLLADMGAEVIRIDRSFTPKRVTSAGGDRPVNSDTLQRGRRSVALDLKSPEGIAHPHNVARQTFVEVDGVRQPAPAPRFSRTVPQLGQRPARRGEHTCEVLVDWRLDPQRVDELIASGAATQG
jgi:crotonobetainyl-CoA:carnitine CoA-transferase CaiB-like acyl-CoA transferase